MWAGRCRTTCTRWAARSCCSASARWGIWPAWCCRQGAAPQAGCLQVDEQSPLVREWAVLAVCNLCEGNSRVQADIAELQAVSALDADELRQAGLHASISPASGKVQVEQRLPAGDTLGSGPDPPRAA